MNAQEEKKAAPHIIHLRVEKFSASLWKIQRNIPLKLHHIHTNTLVWRCSSVCVGVAIQDESNTDSYPSDSGFGWCNCNSSRSISVQVPHCTLGSSSVNSCGLICLTANRPRIIIGHGALFASLDGVQFRTQRGRGRGVGGVSESLPLRFDMIGRMCVDGSLGRRDR